MITLRRAEERRHDLHLKREVWLTFEAEDATVSGTNGFGALQILNETRLSPGASVTSSPHYNAETVTYVREGALLYQDWMGGWIALNAGEFKRTTAKDGLHRRAKNSSRTNGAHVFEIWLRASELGLEPSHEQQRFSVADRRGRLCAVTSPDGRRGSMLIHHDALIYSAMLNRGQHIVHEVSPGRSVWLHVIQGEAKLGDEVLTTGDGAGIRAERVVSITAREETEILLVDLGDDPK